MSKENLQTYEFETALRSLKFGRKMQRQGWNGKGMFIYLVPANKYPAQTEAAKDYWRDKQEPIGENEARPILVPYGAYIAMKTAQENVIPWLASQADLLANDWVEVI